PPPSPTPPPPRSTPIPYTTLFRSELRAKARERLQKVRAAGQERAYLYGADDAGEYKRLNAFFLLTEEPAAYNLPAAPHMPTASKIGEHTSELQSPYDLVCRLLLEK